MAAVAKDREASYRIYHLAATCGTVLTDLLLVLSKKKKTQREYRVVQEYQQRFESWAGYLGVFAATQASLDNRLKYRPDIEAQVIRLLGVVKRNAVYGLRFESSGTSYSGQGASRAEQNEASQAQSDDCVGSNILPATEAALDGIRGALDGLHRLGVTIRKTSNSDIFIKVKKFTEKDPGDHDFFERMNILYVRRLYPKIEDSLVKQLSISVSLRRQRLLRRRQHQMELEASQSQPELLRAYETPGSAQDRVTRSMRIMNRTLPAVDHFSKAESKELPPNLFEAFMKQEIPPGFSTASSSLVPRRLNPYTVPATQIWDGQELCRCNWCFEIFEARGKPLQDLWSSHLKEDFEPYVCISEECSEEPASFVSLNEWRRHMDEFHTEDWAQEIHKSIIWYCDLKQHEYIEFPTAGEFYKHLESHKEEVTMDKLNKMAKRNFISPFRGPDFCPFCMQDFSISSLGAFGTPEYEELATHIASHLMSLAFLSLRYLRDGPSIKSQNAAFSTRAPGPSFQERNRRSESSDFDINEPLFFKKFRLNRHYGLSGPEEPRAPSGRQDFEVAIICMDTLQFNAVVLLFDEVWNGIGPLYGGLEGDDKVFSFGRIGELNVVVVLFSMTIKQNRRRDTPTDVLRDSYHGIRLALLVGICGDVSKKGRDDDMLLGDIIIGDFNFHYYDIGDKSRAKPTHLNRKEPKAIDSLVATIRMRENLERLRSKTAYNLVALQTARGNVSAEGVDEQSEITLISSYEPLPHFGQIQYEEGYLSLPGNIDHHGEMAAKQGVIAFHLGGKPVEHLWEDFPLLPIHGVSHKLEDWHEGGHPDTDWQDFASATAASAAKAVLGFFKPDRQHVNWLLPRSGLGPLYPDLVGSNPDPHSQSKPDRNE
ncbi:hypothetical protein TWF225_008954 [Orbilia oligospora]|nr:hypothetical protein TWF751_009002 [Orbilia oligospora]KAF3175457.1 hypothetical protein TWF225_008954 [Orbilia oligospora]KAF3252000.1 hypothetical protein TWF128_006844 [Orbilia oligospora]KAF3264789.1 hypothetical protein TWF217_002967 [Orbilia oligospora]KAF3278364.1 hypothetical protein TWF132_001218 [Orbilia oligospora]